MTLSKEGAQVAFFFKTGFDQLVFLGGVGGWGSRKFS